MTCSRGGKEVHAADVAKAIEILLNADVSQIRGEAFNCCDGYVTEHDVATLAKEFSGSPARISGSVPTPRHQIATGKIQALGMSFGGRPLLAETVRELLAAHAASIRDR